MEGKSVQLVMDACGIGRKKAGKWLLKSGRDPEKAIKDYMKDQKYQNSWRGSQETGEGLATFRNDGSRSLQVETQEDEWDFNLPVLETPLDLMPGQIRQSSNFDLKALVTAVHNGARLQDIEDYFGYFGDGEVSTHINNDVEAYPSIFYAVQTCDVLIIQTWVTHGGDVNAVCRHARLPLLAYAIILSEAIEKDTTLVVATLLSLGADPTVIPSAFYTPYLRDLPESGPNEANLVDLEDSNKQWCTKIIQKRLARTTTLTQRYNLERAAKMKRPSGRQRWIAKRYKAEGLLGIPYFLIGQTLASNRLIQTLLSDMVNPSTKPLVLVFAGPSGHGKTELARRLGSLLSLDLHVADCTTFKHETDLFGPRDPYYGAKEGSPLNNFLTRKAGQQAIVFLDEFEKTTPEVHNAMLLPFDNGEYIDRRTLQKVNCSSTIWFLATNALDGTINRFCAANEKAIFIDENDAEKALLMRRLSKELQMEFLQKFRAPITGRVSEFIPFLPFSLGEQAVVAHKYLLEFARKIHGPVNLSVGPEFQILGNARLRIRRDASVCQMLAEENYHQDLGARSLRNGVKRVEDILIDDYTAGDEEFIEDGEPFEFAVDVSGDLIVANMVPRDCF